MPEEAIPASVPRALPVWAMGLANMPTGFVYGFISTAMGILLSRRGVSLDGIGTVLFIAFSPTWWAFLLAPVLDVRFSKRFYAYVLAGLAALLLAGAVCALGDLRLFTVLLTASSVAITLYSNAVGGWAPDVLDDAQFDAMSGWFNVANLGAAGVFSVIAVTLVRKTPLHVAAVLLCLLVFAPTLLLLMFPPGKAPEGTLAANFAAMRRDMLRVLRGTRIWTGLVILLSPIAFALTNLFSSLGAEFGAPESWAAGLNGPGVALACSAGCLLAIPVCRRLRRRSVYILAAVGAGLFAAALAVLPHTLPAYAVCLLGYNMFQGFGYTAFIALALEITGPGNALAGSMMALLTASMNLPITMMTKLDTAVHDHMGLRPMLAVDAGSAFLTAALLLVLVLPLMDRWVRRREASQP